MVLRIELIFWFLEVFLEYSRLGIYFDQVN